MDAYDPLNAPDPAAWSALDEPARLELVRRYHAGLEAPVAEDPARVEMHASIHVIVENQAATGDASPVAATLARLVEEGLDRHEAVHAVGQLVIANLQTALGEQRPLQDAFERQVQTLTAEAWRSQGGVLAPRPKKRSLRRSARKKKRKR